MLLFACYYLNPYEDFVLMDEGCWLQMRDFTDDFLG